MKLVVFFLIEDDGALKNIETQFFDILIDGLSLAHLDFYIFGSFTDLHGAKVIGDIVSKLHCL